MAQSRLKMSVQEPKTPATVLDVEPLDPETESFAGKVMNSRAPVERLSQKAIFGLNLYLAGASIKAAAAKCGLGALRLGQVVDSEAGKLYITHHALAVGERLQNYHLEAVETVARELRGKDPRLRLKAAEIILRHASKSASEALKKESPENATAIAKALLAGLDISITSKPKLIGPEIEITAERVDNERTFDSDN